jgi:DNA-binding NarL/FixJ family response regulator
VSTAEIGSKQALRVVVADDDPFTLSLVGDGLRAQGFEVITASSAEDAYAAIGSFEPNAVVTDLNFGDGTTGAALLSRVHDEFPWLALVVLTSHQSPELAVDDPESIPADVVYVVKSQLKRVDQLTEAIEKAIAGTAPEATHDEGGDDDVFTVTASQADVLRMLATGVSTRAIAEKRGTTVRAAEAMIARLYSTLGLETDELAAPRVAAIRLWQQGRVRVR